MTIRKKVELQKDETCEGCKEVIEAGNVALKDRREKKTKYFHTNHVKT